MYMYNWTLEWTLGLIVFQVWWGCGRAQLSRAIIEFDGCLVHPVGAKSSNWAEHPSNLMSFQCIRVGQGAARSQNTSMPATETQPRTKQNGQIWLPSAGFYAAACIVFQNDFENLILFKIILKKNVVFQNDFEKNLFFKMILKTHSRGGTQLF